MISYDNYKNRIEKLAKAKRILHKFRFLIGGALGVIIAGSVGLMVAKGVYTSDMSLPALISFGEEYKPTYAKAFLASESSQKVEYRRDGENEWTTQKPVKAGKYSARTVSPKLVGYSYSNVVDFEIVPIDASFTITGSSVVYGNVPAHSVTGLIAGHSVDLNELVFNYSDNEVTVDESTFKITDGNGDDFTDCYNVTFSGKQLAVSQRSITVKPQSASYTYGDSISYDGNTADEKTTVERLANGDTIEITTRLVKDGWGVSKIEDAGNYSVEVQTCRISHGGEDVTSRYNISLQPATVRVDKRRVTFTTESGSKVYDGTALKKEGLTSQNLVSGHYAEPDGELPAVIDAGRFNNKYSVNIFNADGKDVTDNYAVSYGYGVLEITRREVTLTTNDKEWTYDGEAHNFVEEDGYALSEKLSGFTYVPTYLGTASEITDYGTKPNKMGIDVYNTDGENVSHNFDFKTVWGTLKINKRNITVTTGDLDEEFNGEAQYTESGEVTSGSLVDGHYVRALAPYATIKNVGTSANTTKFAVYSNSGNSVADNYEVSYVPGTLKITPKYIIVKTNAATKEYDGTPLSDVGYTTDLNPFGEELYNGDKLIQEGYVTEITEVGRKLNNNGYRLPNGNYFIRAFGTGVLEIVPKEVTVYLNNASVVYGEEIGDYGFNLSCGTLPNNETLSLTTRLKKDFATVEPEEWQGYTLLNVGPYRIEAIGAEITGGNARLENYDFKFIDGTLEITPREIVVITESASKEYDGSPLQNTAYATEWAGDREKAGLLGDDINTLIPATDTTTLLEVYTCENSNQYIAPNNNYTVVKHEFGTLTITKRPIMITTADKVKPYDGEPLFKTDGYTVAYAVYDKAAGEWKADNGKQGLVDGDELTLVGAPAKITDAGTAENICGYTHVNSYGSSNYDIHYTYGTLTVEKRIIDLEAPFKGHRAHYGFFRSNSFRYLEGTIGFTTSDGEALTLPEGQELAIWFRFVGLEGAPEVGKHTVEAFKYEIGGDEGDGNSLKNYIITCPDDEMEIYAAPLSVKVGDRTATYGDKDLPDNTYEVTDGKIYFGETIEFEYGYDREVKDVGDYEITVTGVKVYDKDGNLKENGAENYDIQEIVNGTLTVTRKKLKVYLNYSGAQIEEIYYGTPWVYATGVGNYFLAEGLLDGEELEITAGIADSMTELDGTVKYYYTGYNPETGKFEPNAGGYFTEMTGGKIYVGGVEKENGLNNYDYDYFNGNLRVLRKEIEVTIDGDTITFGQSAEGMTYTYAVTEGLDGFGKLPYGDELTIADFVYKQDGEEVTPKDAGEYSVEGGTVLVNGDEEGAKNYTVKYKGTLTVEKLLLEIRHQWTGYSARYGVNTNGFTKTTTKNSLVFVADNSRLELPYGQDICVNWRILGVGEDEVPPASEERYVLRAISFEIYTGNYYNHTELDSGDGDSLKNYIVRCEDSSLSVQKTDIIIEVEDVEIEYGDDLPELNYSIEEKTSVVLIRVKETFENVKFGFEEEEVKSVGIYHFTVESFEVYDRNGDLMPGGCNNYEVTCTGTLTIKPKNITISLENKRLTYGDTVPTSGNDYNILENGVPVHNGTLVGGETLEVSVIYYMLGDEKVTMPRNVGEYTVVADGYKVFKDGIEVENGADNYEIKCENGTLEIWRKHLEIQLLPIDSVEYGDTFAYAGGTHNYEEAGANGELAYDELLHLELKYNNESAPKNVGKYTAEVDYYNSVVYEADGVTEVADGAKNYYVVLSGARTCEITKRKISVKVLNFYGEDAVVYGDYDFDTTFPYPNDYHNYEEAEGLQYNEDIRLNVKYYYTVTGIGETAPKNVGIYYILPTIGNTALRHPFEVCDEYGNEIEDGYKNYQLETTYAGRMDIVARDIYLYLDDIEDVTYGDSFAYGSGIGNYKDIENIVYGEQLEITAVLYYTEGIDSNVIPRNAGTYSILPAEDSIKIYDEDGNYLIDGAGNYVIHSVAGTLKINYKSLVVQIFDKSCTYGDAIPVNTYRLTESYYSQTQYTLPYGDKFALTEYDYYAYSDSSPLGDLVTPRNAGKYHISGKNGEFTNNGIDVSSNYLLSYRTGTLTIDKADLDLQLLSINNAVYGDYRGYPEGIDKFDKDNTVGIQHQDQLELAVEYEVYSDPYRTGLVTVGDKSTEIPKNVALYHINLDVDNSVIHTTEGEQFGLALNYNVNCGYVAWSITRRAVLVSYSLPEYTYGETVAKPDFTIEVMSEEIDEGEISTTILPYGETCDFDFDYKYSGKEDSVIPKNAGTYKVYIIRRYVNDSEALSKNYQFALSRWDDLIINKKAVEINFTDMEIEYGDFVEKNEDGSYHYQLMSFNSVEYEVGENGGLEYGETLEARFHFLLNGKISAYNKVGTYDRELLGLRITDENGDTEAYSSVSLSSGTLNKFANYLFTFNAGILKVTEKAITVEINDNFCYYGDDISALTNSYKDLGELPFGDTLIPDYEYNPAEITNVGDYAITANTFTVERNGVAVENGGANYKVKVVDGTLTVMQLALTVTVGDYSADYGKPLPEIEYAVTNSDGEAITLPNGETLTVTFAYQCGVQIFTAPQNVNVYDIVVATEEIDGGNGEISNYDITYELGTLTIERLAITVTIESNSCIYGEDLPEIEYSVSEETGYGEELELTFRFNNQTTVKNAGIYDISVATETIVGGNASADNYVITYKDNSPKLTINQKEITLSLCGGEEEPSFEYGYDFAEDMRTVKADGMEYGERIVANVKYREASGTQFGETVPENAGDYVAKLEWENCAVYLGNAEVLDGIGNYKLADGAEVPELEFEIYKKSLEITIVSDGCDYGDPLPEIEFTGAENLPYGDKLNLTFDFESKKFAEVKNADTYAILVATEDIVGGNGSLQNYDITYADNSPELVIAPREISFKLRDIAAAFGSKVTYPVGKENYDNVFGAAYDEQFEVTVKFYKDGAEIANPTDAGKYDIILDGFTVYDASGKLIVGGDKNYTCSEPELSCGTLDISSSVIKIETGGDTKEYDGTPLYYTGYDFDSLDFIIEGTLAEGYTVEIDEQFGPTEVTDEEGVENKTTFKVLFNGTPTDNYKVTYQYGYLTVTQRTVNVTAYGDTKTYDGNPLTAGYELELASDESADAIVEGHTLQATLPEQTDAGTRDNIIDFAVSDGDGNDVTANYKFVNVSVGELKVTPKAVEVTLKDVTAIYGEEIAECGKELDCGELYNGDELTFEVVYTLGGVAVEPEYVDGYTLLNCGTYAFKYVEGSAKVNGEVSQNYTFHFVEGTGTLIIEQRGIIVTTADKSKLYDGTPLYLGGYTTAFEGDTTADGLLNGDTLITLESELTDAALGITDKGTKSNVFTFSVPEDGNYKIIAGETTYGTLEIVARKLIIVTGSDKKPYDGQPLEAAEAEDYYVLDENDARDYTLLGTLNHDISLTKAYSIVNATVEGGVPNLAEYTVVDIDGNDISNNYEIVHESGYLEITPIKLTITLNANEKTSFEFGDTTVASEIENYDYDGLIDGEELTVAVTYTYNGGIVAAPRNAGGYTASFYLGGSSVDNGTELTNSIGNYDIECEEVEFEITSKAVTLEMGEWADEVYNGNPHSFTNHTLSDGEWAEYGETIAVAKFSFYTDEERQNSVAAPVDAGTYYVYLDVKGTFMSNGTAISVNYDVTCEPITFNVLKKQITITMSDVESVYDGDGYDFAQATDGFEVSGLCGDDEVERTVLYTDNKTDSAIASPVNAGKYTITYDASKFDMPNYAIAEDGNTLSCTLTIKPRDLTVKVMDRKVELGTDEEYTTDHIVTDFIGSDLENAGASFNATLDAVKPAGAVAQYTVTVEFANADVMNNYNVVKNESGTLVIVHRWVEVAPEYTEEKSFVYNGEAVPAEYFDISHVHKSESQLEADDLYGFREEDVAKMYAVYTFVNVMDENDIYTDGEFPVNAGTYTVTVKLYGIDEYVIEDDYFVEYKSVTFTIEKRNVTLATQNDVENGGITEFVYDNKEPAYKAILVEDTSAYGDGECGIIGELPEAEFELYINNEKAEKFNAGTYQVRATFEGIENYNVSWNYLKIVIVKRNLIFGPVNNYSGAQYYNGENLTIGSGDYVLYQGTTLADGDELFIEASSLEPTKASGSVSITGAKVTGADNVNDDKSANYELLYSYRANDKLFEGLRRSSFMVTLEYKKWNVHYNQTADGGEYPFSGSKITHEFDGGNAFEIIEGEGYDALYDDGNITHTLDVTADTVTVGSDAGTYAGWLTSLLKVTDSNGRNVTALYNFVCDNAEDENKPVVITRYVVTVTLDESVTKDSLFVGEDGVLTQTADGKLTLIGGKYEIDGLLPIHSAQIFAFDTDDGKLLAVSIYGTRSSGTKFDVIENYELTPVAALEGVEIKYMTLDEIEQLSKPSLKITLDGEVINAESIEGGRGELFVPSAIDGSWVLTDGVTVEGLKDGHHVDVAVYVTESGYALAVGVYRINTSGGRTDVSATYNIKLPEEVGGLPVSLVNAKDDFVELKRDIVFDFSGFVYEEDGKLADGSFDIDGLNTADSHVAEVYVEANEDGSYEFTVLIFKYKTVGSREIRTDKLSVYNAEYVLPEGVVINVKTADVGTIYS